MARARSIKWPVICAMLFIVVAMALLSILTIYVLSGVRAYVSGESLWSKGQKDAAISLLRYADTQHPEEFARFEKALSIPLGDRAARLALDDRMPDRTAAREGFLQGGNQPGDVEAMINLFAWFRDVDFMARAIAVWADADAELDRFRLIAGEIRDAVRVGSGRAELSALLDRVRESNARLTLLEQRFSDALGDSSRLVRGIVSALTIGLAIVLAFGGTWVIQAAFARLARLERSLRESNDRWTIAARGAKLELFDWDLATDVVTSHLARGVQTAPFARFLDNVAEEDRSRLNEVLTSAKASRSRFSSDHRMRGDAGEEKWKNFLGTFLYLDDGAPYRMLGVRVDITERKLAQSALRESELRYRTLWETAPDAVVLLDENGRINYANASVTRTFGWENSELVGQNIEMLQPAGLRAAHRTGLARYLRTGQRTVDWLATAAMGLHRDGHEFALEISFSHTKEGERHLFAGFLRDVEARTRGETERSRLADLVDKSLIETYLFDTSTLLLEYSNKAARENQPRTLAEFGALTLVDLMPDLSVEAYRARLVPLLAGTERLISYSAEHLRADGSRYPVDVTVQLVGPADQQVLLVTALDVTERVASDASRRALVEQLRQSQKMESLGTLAGGIAHDFNNIVGAMLGNVALARDELPRQHPARESVDQINKAALRARELVAQILAFSRQQAPKFLDQSIQPIVLETLQLLRASLPASIVLEVDMPDKPVFVRADATQIEQVLMNLCTNAWRATDEDVAAVIKIGVAQRNVIQDTLHSVASLPRGSYAHLWVTDTGAGMDAVTRSRIFEPFFTTRPVGQGTGLGLSVVHGIIVAHQGAITVDSEVGKGSTFHIYLPLQLAPVEPDHGTAPLSGFGALVGQSEHVLYVDDDELMLLVVERLLHRAGYRVTAVSDARAAVEMLRQNPTRYDLVLSDFNMPDMSGFELTKAVTAISPDLPVVIISGDISDVLSDEAARLGVAALVQKQYAFEQLADVLHRVFAGEGS